MRGVVLRLEGQWQLQDACLSGRSAAGLHGNNAAAWPQPSARREFSPC